MKASLVADALAPVVAMEKVLTGTAGRAAVAVTALAEADLGKVGRVFTKGLFGPAAGFRVVVEHFRNASFVDALEVLDFRDQGHASVHRFIGQPSIPIRPSQFKAGEGLQKVRYRTK